MLKRIRPRLTYANVVAKGEKQKRGTLGFVLAAGMAVSAVLVLRVDDPLEGRAGPVPARSG